MTKTAAVVINLGIIVVVVGGVLLLVKRHVDKQTGEAAVVSTQATKVQVRDPTKESGEQDTTGYNWRATYQVAGRSYTIGETEDVTYDPSVRYKICYDPANPGDGSLARPETHCGSMF